MHLPRWMSTSWPSAAGHINSIVIPPFIQRPMLPSAGVYALRVIYTVYFWSIPHRQEGTKSKHHICLPSRGSRMAELPPPSQGVRACGILVIAGERGFLRLLAHRGPQEGTRPDQRLPLTKVIMCCCPPAITDFTCPDSSCKLDVGQAGARDVI